MVLLSRDKIQGGDYLNKKLKVCLIVLVVLITIASFISCMTTQYDGLFLYRQYLRRL